MADLSRFEYTSLKGNRVRLIGIENVNTTNNPRLNRWIYSVKNLATNEISEVEKLVFFASVIPNEYDRTNKI